MAHAELPNISAHPLNVMNTEAIETAAATIESLGKTVGDNGAQAVTAWAPISAAYKGPGDAELIAVMAPVATMASSLEDRTASAARSLRTFKDTADEIKATMATLKLDLAAHKRDVANFEPSEPTGGRVPRGSTMNDWWDDDSLTSENERIIKGLNDCVERMHEAERVCMNEIRALHCIVPLEAGDGGLENNQYGVDTIPHDAETPWGTASPDDESCAEATGSWIVNAGKDLGGLVGMQWDEDGNFSWTVDNFVETWKGMGALITYNAQTNEWFDWGLAGETWLGAGKDFIAYDRWGENPEGAGTDVALNVVSSIGIVGIIAKVGKVGKLGRLGRHDVDADVDIDAGDFDMPDLDVDLDLDLDLGDIDLDIPKPDLDVDLPGDRPDVPGDRPDVPVNAPDAPGDGVDAPDAPGDGVDAPAAPGDGADAPGNGADAPGDGADGPDGADGADPGSPAPIDPRAAERVPNTDVDFQGSDAYDQAVQDRVDAVEARRDAVQARDDAIADLAEMGVRVDPADLTKSKIDNVIADLKDGLWDDPDLTPDEIAARSDALDDLADRAWAERASFTDQVNASERMGDAAARDVIAAQDADVVIDGGGASSGQFDQIGLTRDGDTMIFAEAKGGTANLSSTGRLLPDGTRAAQGSTLYFNDVFRVDGSLQQYLADNPRIAQGLLDGSIEVRYQVVRADVNGVVHVEDLLLDPRTLDLQIPGADVRQPVLVGAGDDTVNASAAGVMDPVADGASRMDVPDAGYAMDGAAVAADRLGGRFDGDTPATGGAGTDGPVSSRLDAWTSTDPVHSTQNGVPGEWERLPDATDLDTTSDPVSATPYGEPMMEHGHEAIPQASGTLPSGFDYVSDPSAPFGRHRDGTLMTNDDYDSRYVMAENNYDRYPPNAGAVAGTRVEYVSIDAFIRDYGTHVDRIGLPAGHYLGLRPDGVAASFESRSLPIGSLDKPVFEYSLTGELPTGWRVEISEIAPAFGRDGGSLQMIFKDDSGQRVSVADLVDEGVLR